MINQQKQIEELIKFVETKVGSLFILKANNNFYDKNDIVTVTTKISIIHKGEYGIVLGYYFMSNSLGLQIKLLVNGNIGFTGLCNEVKILKQNLRFVD